MNSRTLIFSALTVLLMVSVSCNKDNSTTGGGGVSEIEQKANAFKTYLTGKSFIPVDFYSNIPIDYDETDNNTATTTDLKPYILPYLSDDVIVLNSGGTITLNQGSKLIPPPNVAPSNPVWGVEFSKAKNEVYLNYLDYYYVATKYVLDDYNDSVMVAHVIWKNNAQTVTANLYTKFRKL